MAIIATAGIIGYFFLGKKQKEQRESETVVVRISKSGMISNIAILLILGCCLLLFLNPTSHEGQDIHVQLVATFGGMSLVLFGGGYVFIPFIQEVIVTGKGWLTNREFTDAIAIGQVTPGPIMISAAFVGYKLKGILGAILATIGIFAPTAALVVVVARFAERLKSSNIFNRAIKGVRLVVIGMIAVAAVKLGEGAHMGWQSAVIFSAVLIGLQLLKLQVIYIIPLAGLAGFLLF